MNICVMITDGFEDSEYQQPASALLEAGHTLTHVGTRGGTVTGKNGEAEVTIDKLAPNVSAMDFDALFIPGGNSPDALRVDESIIKLAEDFVTAEKPVLMICHGPQILITADVLRGRAVTGYTSIVQDLKNAGADFVDEAVVIDKNFVSSRNPGDLPEFTAASLKALEG